MTSNGSVPHKNSKFDTKIINALTNNSASTSPWKPPRSNAITIIEDVEEEVQSVQDTRIVLTNGAEHTRSGAGGQDVKLTGDDVNQNVAAINTSRPLRRTESLTVPGTVVNMSPTKDDAVIFGADSVTLAREPSKLSMLSIESRRSLDSRIQQTMTAITATAAAAEEEKQEFAQEESWIRMAIPHLPLWMAVVCLVMNILIPGSGTVLSGFSIVCGAKPRITSKEDGGLMMTCCVNTWVGVAQLLTVTFLLVGWFWSLAWGIRMVILSVEKRKQLKAERAKQLKTMALSAFGNTVPPQRT